MLSTFTLLTTHDYVADAISRINQAKSRVYLATTTLIVDDDLSAGLINAIKYAASRGVEVSIAADAFTYTELRDFTIGGHLKNKRAIVARKLKTDIESSGAKVHWMGKFSAIAITGRTHSKWCVVDDVVYSFGGVNLDRRSFTNLDYMLRIKNSQLADDIVHEHNRMLRADREHHSYRSYSLPHDKDDSLLIDGGFVGDSIIYRRACQLAKESKKITFVSQYCPTGKLSRLLKKTDSSLYFNHWTNAGDLNRLVIRYGMLFGKHESRYQRVPYLHAKFIIFELNDGKKIAITGSHNFVYAGVLVGTREIALETHNRRVIKQLESFLKQYIA